MRIYNEYFLGIILISLGVLLLIRHIFNLNLPIFRILAGVVFLYIGISIIFGGAGIKSGPNLVFSEGTIEAGGLDQEYNMIFSNGVVDLTNLPSLKRAHKLKVNTIFANGTIRINPQEPIILKVNSVFANAILPDNSSISFGNNTYMTKTFKPDTNYLEVEASVVFGKLTVELSDS